MKFFTKLIERFGKAPRIENVPPQAAEVPASTHRPEPVQVSAEQPLAPGVHPEEAPSVPANVGG